MHEGHFHSGPAPVLASRGGEASKIDVLNDVLADWFPKEIELAVDFSTAEGMDAFDVGAGTEDKTMMQRREIEETTYWHPHDTSRDVFWHSHLEHEQILATKMQ